MVGLGGVAAASLLGAGLILKGLAMDVGPGQMAPFIVGTLFLVLACLGGYWTWSCRTLAYVVDRNALAIQWGSLRQVVPIDAIERLIPGADEDESPQIEGVNWPGHHVGRSEIADFGNVLFYSTHRTPGEVLYVMTPAEVYAISVEDPVVFAQAVQNSQARGPLFGRRQAVHRSGIAKQSFWLDRYARLLSLVLIGAFLLVLGYVLQTYPGLSDSVQLRSPAFGGIIRVADKSELLDLPRSAGGFLLLNLVLAVVLHTWDRMVGYVLLLAGIAIQVMLLVAAIVAVA
ncbi:MAG: hypothetical protein GEU75_14255 [Dehalococcoidia bacterium]|nr:hypothetical protein [Dehalococcoidia bacterium]